MCIAHAPGTYMLGANTALCENKPQVRVGDMIIYTAPPIVGMALSGSRTVMIEKAAAHRVGDQVLGAGVGIALKGATTKNTGG